MNGAVHAALAAKEWRESCPAVIAGAAIYLAMPIVLTFVNVLIDPRHELVGGFAGTVWAATGWIFAAVLGAQLVCRDFGGATGDFLMARPVSVRSVVCIKALVGFKLMLSFVLVVGIMEVPLSFASDAGQFSFRFFVGGSIVALLSFGVAFVAATITRQTLSSVMLAGLVVILVLVGPLITHQFAWISARFVELHDVMQFSWQADAAGAITPLCALVAIGVVAAPIGTCRFRNTRICATAITLILGGYVAWLVFRYTTSPYLYAHPLHPQLQSAVDRANFTLAVALSLFVVIPIVLITAGLVLAIVAARSERAVRFGTRSLSWTVAIVMLSLCLAAVNEVGADVPISATIQRDAGRRGAFATGQHRFARIVHHNLELATIQPSIEVYNVELGGDIAPTAVVSFVNRLDDTSGWIYGSFGTQQSLLISAFQEDGKPGWTVRRFLLVFDSDDRLFLLFHRQTVQRMAQAESTTKPAPYRDRKFMATRESRISILRIDEKSQTASQAATFELPKLPSPGGYPYLADAAIEDGMLLLVFDLSTPNNDLNRPRAVLARYSFENSGPPELMDTVDMLLRDGWWSVAATDPIQAARTGAVWPNPWDPRQLSYTRFFRGGDGRLYLTGYPFSLNYIADGFNGNPLIDPVRLAAGLPGFTHYSNDRGQTASMVALVCGSLPLDERHAAACGQFGLAISQQPKPRQPSTVVGRYWASPLSMLFRSDRPRLLAAGPSLLLEIHKTSVIGYDVSDLTRPRRIAHVRSPRIVDAKLTDDALILDHGFGFSVVSLADIRAKAGLKQRPVTSPEP